MLAAGRLDLAFVIVTLLPLLLIAACYFAALSQVEDRSSGHLRDCLRRADLPDAAVDRRADGYSKGMRQKVGLALAIAKNARALLLDEPTSGLDPQASAEFHDLVVRQRDEMREGRLRRMLDARDITAVELEGLYLEEMGHGDR